MVIISVPQPFVGAGSPAAATTAMARKQAMGLVLDWLLVNNGEPMTAETLMVAHCSEKMEYRARLNAAGNVFGPIVEEAHRARMVIVRDFRTTDDEIDHRLRGGHPEMLTGWTWLALWERKEELFAALTASETAFPRLDRSVRTFAAWRAL